MTIATFGDVSISKIIEIESLPTRPNAFVPDITPEIIEANLSWLAPHFYNQEKNLFLFSIHSYLIRTPQHTILVDTCVGNHKDRKGQRPWHMLNTDYLDKLAATGVAPEEIDFVLCTHLHVDHIGWNTKLEDGRWVPTFPNAKYIISEREWQFWRQEDEAGKEPFGLYTDSILPVIESQQAVLVKDDYSINDQLWLEPSPGHTPGHVCLCLAADDKKAVFTGDMMHHPIQVYNPDWNSSFCVNPELSRKTRRAFVERYSDTGTTIFAAHFPKIGTIKSHGANFQFQV